MVGTPNDNLYSGYNRVTDIISDVIIFGTSLPGEELTELEELGVQCFPLDVTSTESVKTLKDHFAKLQGENLDVLINCAYVYFLRSHTIYSDHANYQLGE